MGRSPPVSSSIKMHQSNRSGPKSMELGLLFLVLFRIAPLLVLLSAPGVFTGSANHEKGIPIASQGIDNSVYAVIPRLTSTFIQETFWDNNNDNEVHKASNLHMKGRKSVHVHRAVVSLHVPSEEGEEAGPPLGEAAFTLKSKVPMKIWIMPSASPLDESTAHQHSFETVHLFPDQPVTMYTNSQGRFHFAIPVDPEQDEDEGIAFIAPALYIQTLGMPSSDWYLFYVDQDIHHRIAKLSVDHLDVHSFPSPIRIVQKAFHAFGKAFLSVHHSQHSKAVMDDNTDKIESNPHMMQHATVLRYWLIHEEPMLKESSHRMVDSRLAKRALEVIPPPGNSRLVARALSSMYQNDSSFGMHQHYYELWESLSRRAQHTLRELVRGFHSFLRYLGLALRDFLIVLHNTFHWPAVSRVQAMLSKYFDLACLSQNVGAMHMADTLSVGIRNATAHQSAMFDDTIRDLHGVPPDMMSQGHRVMNHTYFSASGMDAVSSDIRVAYVHDLVFGNVSRLNEAINSASVKSDTVQWDKFILLLDRYTAELSRHFGSDVLEAAKVKLSDFTSNADLSKINKTMIRLLEFAKHLNSLVRDLGATLIHATVGFLAVAMQLLYALVTLPLHIPFLERWKENYLLPDDDNPLSLMTLLTLSAAPVVTYSYMGLVGGEPLSNKDIIALQSATDFHYLSLSWNDHPLTRTKDIKELRRRNAIMDWLPRTAAAWYTVLGVSTVLYTIPSGRAVKIFADQVNCVTTYLVSAWVYPLNQLSVRDEAKVLEDLKNPYPTLWMWWSGYTVTELAKAMKNSFLVGKDGSSVVYDRTALLTAGLTQTIGMSMMAKVLYGTLDGSDWRRTALFGISLFAWVLDTLSFYLFVLPNGFLSGSTQLGSIKAFTAAYMVRALFMMAYNVVGMIKPDVPVPLDEDCRPFTLCRLNYVLVTNGTRH